MDGAASGPAVQRSAAVASARVCVHAHSKHDGVQHYMHERSTWLGRCVVCGSCDAGAALLAVCCLLAAFLACLIACLLLCLHDLHLPVPFCGWVMQPCMHMTAMPATAQQACSSAADVHMERDAAAAGVVVGDDDEAAEGPMRAGSSGISSGLRLENVSSCTSATAATVASAAVHAACQQPTLQRQRHISRRPRRRC